MKAQQFVMIAAMSLLCGCAGKAAPQEPVPTAAAPAETAEPQGTPSVSSDDLRSFQSGLEPYENLEITFLGTVSIDQPLEDVLARARSENACAAAIDDSRVFCGERGEYTDYVYLLVPALNTDLKIGQYNWYAGGITETWVDETDALPLIYVESGDSTDPLGRIEYVRHLSDGDSEDFLYTGLNLGGKLRTDYHMGVVDQTDYQSFDSSEIPFYMQYFHDTLMTYEEIADAVQKGGKLTAMEEMTWEGHAYMVYDLERNGTNTLYAIRHDSESGYPQVLTSRDSGASWETLGHG